MAEDLGDKVEQTEHQLEEIGHEFAQLVTQRKYDEARVYYKGMNKEQQDYITGHKEYRWMMKALRASCF